MAQYQPVYAQGAPYGAPPPQYGVAAAAPGYPAATAYPAGAPGYPAPGYQSAAVPTQVTYVQYQEVPPPVQQTIIVTERQPNHCAHCLVFFLTGGLWLPCWIGHCVGCCNWF